MCIRGGRIKHFFWEAACLHKNQYRERERGERESERKERDRERESCGFSVSIQPTAKPKPTVSDQLSNYPASQPNQEQLKRYKPKRERRQNMRKH